MTRMFQIHRIRKSREADPVWMLMTPDEGGLEQPEKTVVPGVWESHPRLLRVAVPFPFPEKLAADFLRDLDEVLCIEELDPVIERELIRVCGKYGLNVRIRGKGTGDIAPSGENTVDSVAEALAAFLGDDSLRVAAAELPELPPLPVRPPVLCAGCPHRASFYAVKQAMKGRKTFYGGDIGCYTLGNAAPLDMCDTCLCMGAGINIAQGIWRTEPDTKCFAFVGDSTFFASGITGVVNAVYNQADLTLIVLDNSAPATSRYRTDHDGPGGGKSQHRAHTGSDRAYSRGNRQPARSAGSGSNGQENSGPAGSQGNHFQVALHCARESGSGFRRTEGSVYRL